MTSPTSRENSTRALSTADLAATSRQPPRVSPDPHEIEEPEFEQPARDRDTSARDREESAGDPGASARDREESVRERGASARDRDANSLEPLFVADQAEDYRTRWAAIQSSFVDDPSGAVRAGDELVAQVMSDLANTFAEQRHRIESSLDTSGSADTEDLRVALTSYRSFFERLLSL